MVQHLEHAFRLVDGQRVIQRGHGVFEQHGKRVHQRGEQQDAAAVVYRLHHKDGNGGNGQKRADAVRDGVGYLLAQRVLAHVALPVRLVRRGLRRLIAMHSGLAQVARLELGRRPGMGSSRRCRGFTGAGRHIRRCRVCRFSIHRHQLYHTRSITAPVCCAPVAKRLRNGSQRLAGGVILGNGTPGATRRRTST